MILCEYLSQSENEDYIYVLITIILDIRSDTVRKATHESVSQKRKLSKDLRRQLHGE